MRQVISVNDLMHQIEHTDNIPETKKPFLLPYLFFFIFPSQREMISCHEPNVLISLLGQETEVSLVPNRHHFHIMIGKANNTRTQYNQKRLKKKCKTNSRNLID